LLAVGSGVCDPSLTEFSASPAFSSILGMALFKVSEVESSTIVCGFSLLLAMVVEVELNWRDEVGAWKVAAHTDAAFFFFYVIDTIWPDLLSAFAPLAALRLVGPCRRGMGPAFGSDLSEMLNFRRIRARTGPVREV
jgi:hypothetical protein